MEVLMDNRTSIQYIKQYWSKSKDSNMNTRMTVEVRKIRNKKMRETMMLFYIILSKYFNIYQKWILVAWKRKYISNKNTFTDCARADAYALVQE